MKGVINKGIQDLVEKKCGVEAWEYIKREAMCKEPFFSAHDNYPDQMTLDLANSAAQIADLSLETVLIEFGKYWVSNTGAKSYPTFFKLAGKNAREFLINMDKVHRMATKGVDDAMPPHFEYEELPDGRLLMHYQSHRKLCPLFFGLIQGVAIYFGEKLRVRETACMHKGAPGCTMEVTFLGS